MTRRLAPSGYPYCVVDGCQILGTFRGRCGRHDGVEDRQLSLDLAEHVVAVHCFYGCGHVERHGVPGAVHDAMERHYAAAHVGTPS